MSDHLTSIGAYFEVVTADQCRADTLSSADGIIFATPENFGSMSGAMKSVFDRNYYEWSGQKLALPCAFWVAASTDGQNTAIQLEKLCKAVGFKMIVEPVIFKGRLSDHWSQSISSDRLTNNRIKATEQAQLLSEGFYTALEMGLY